MHVIDIQKKKYWAQHRPCETLHVIILTAGLLFPSQVSLWNDLVDPVFDGVGLAGFKSRSNAFLLALSIFVFNYFPFLFFSSIGW